MGHLSGNLSSTTIAQYNVDCRFFHVLNFVFLECTDGLYGDMCQNQCGHCSNLSQCHHINGTCLSGCQPGYSSEFCNQCELISFIFLDC